MIIESLINLFVNLIQTALSAFDLLSLPVEIISVLTEITGYGAWIVGFDLILIVGSIVTTVYVIRLTVGLLVFIWELLPLT